MPKKCIYLNTNYIFRRLLKCIHNRQTIVQMYNRNNIIDYYITNTEKDNRKLS